MPIESLVHSNTLAQLNRDVLRYKKNTAAFQLFTRDEFREIFQTQPHIDLLLRTMLEDGARFLPGFDKKQYALGFLFAHYTIRKSLEAAECIIPTITQQTCLQGSKNLSDIVAKYGAETMQRHVVNEAKTLMPELIGLFNSIRYPMTVEVYWGIADVASLFAIELGLDQ